ncbi:MAG: cytochrome C [Thermoanaerobaculia bacterium]
MKEHLPFPVLRAIFVALVTLNPSTAHAVASYARQTGLACNGCHTTPPELNTAGRTFKLLGYTDRALDTGTVTSAPGEHHSALDLLKSLPLSALVETSFTSTKSAQPGTQNRNFEFPQDVSVFLAGAWTKHVGSFVQVTYNKQNDHFSIDNSDIRYANKGKLAGKELVYGLTLNNNPTVEDLWNSTPAWGYPWIASDSAPTPSAHPLVQGGLAQDVAGIGGYGMWNDHLYLASTIYRSDHIGSPQPTSGIGFAINIRNVAPYWRVAWQQSIGSDNYLEVGGYGMHLKSTPNSVAGLEDEYTDWAADLQFDRTMFVRDVLSVRATYIHETSSLAATFNQGGAAQVGHTLHSFAANVGYHFGNRYSATLGWFDVGGTPDTVLYSSAAVTGSANGSPKSAGYIANLSWWPMQNLQVAFQYTAYTRFNGAATNYDGAGRNASDNNTAYVLARFIF